MASDLSRRTPLWLRGTAIVLGVLTLIWLPFEDTQVTYAVLLAAGWCAWGLARVFVRRPFSGLTSSGLAGAVAGLAVAPLAVFLMVLKGGLHAHGFPDFALLQILSTLAATPWWGLAGLSSGLLAAWLKSRMESKDKQLT